MRRQVSLSRFKASNGGWSDGRCGDLNFFSSQIRPVEHLKKNVAYVHGNGGSTPVDDLVAQRTNVAFGDVDQLSSTERLLEIPAID